MIGDEDKFARSFRRTGWLISLIFVAVAVMFVGSIVWHFYLFTACRAEGGTIIQCNAAVSNPNYIAVDEVEKK